MFSGVGSGELTVVPTLRAPDAGIYTIIDLALPLNGSINRASPAWTTDLLGLYTTTIDSFSKVGILAFLQPVGVPSRR